MCQQMSERPRMCTDDDSHRVAGDGNRVGNSDVQGWLTTEQHHLLGLAESTGSARCQHEHMKACGHGRAVYPSHLLHRS
jgi:hypothetical protein